MNEDEMKRKTNLYHGLHLVYHIRQLNIILPVSNKEVEMISCCVYSYERFTNVIANAC